MVNSVWSILVIFSLLLLPVV